MLGELQAAKEMKRLVESEFGTDNPLQPPAILYDQVKIAPDNFDLVIQDTVQKISMPTFVTLKQAEQRSTQRLILRIWRPSGETNCSPICRMTFCMAKSAVMIETRACELPASSSPSSSPDDAVEVATLPSSLSDGSGTSPERSPPPSRNAAGWVASCSGSLGGGADVAWLAA